MKGRVWVQGKPTWQPGLGLGSWGTYLPDLQFDPLPLNFHSSDLEINSWSERCEAR